MRNLRYNFETFRKIYMIRYINRYFGLESKQYIFIIKCYIILLFINIVKHNFENVRNLSFNLRQLPLNFDLGEDVFVYECEHSFIVYTIK